MLMATMSLMRMSLIHPLLPGGREITIQFSPSRRHLISQLARDNKNRCVCCENLPGQKKSDEKDQNDSNKDTLTEAEAAALADVAVATEDEHLEDNSFGASNAPSGARDKASKKKSRNNFGDLIPMDPEFCHAVHECPHYVHKKCLIQLQSDCEDELKCPRCKDLHFRLHLAETKDDRHEVYCEHIPVGHNQQGITVTAKIGEIIKWAQEIPEGDKAIVYSFFKGGLDIIEGIFVEHLGIECARFDGDVTPDERSKELAKFKKSKTCRILLASVQSSGVGLNIVEANHVAFLDRWFNPCVHAQAEDRCHRLKQTKEVSVKYFDANMTVDQVSLFIVASLETLSIKDLTDSFFFK
jgi:SNF2 family DNA or RNA helicase